MRKGFLMLILVLAVGIGSYGQTTWRFFISPNNDFKVELPKNSKIQSVELSSEEESITEMFRNKGKPAYYEIEANDSRKSHRFRVLIFYPNSNWNDQKFDSEANSNMLFLFGDDKRFSKQSDVKIAGLHGREYIFTKGDRSGRSLFLNAKKRIYFLFYSDENNAEPESAIVNKVFSTFRVLN